MITKEMRIGDVIEKHPETVEVMLKYGLHCIGCRISPFETIAAGCLTHGMTEEEIERMVGELNEIVKK